MANNEYQNSILDAIDYLIDNKISRLDRDKTIIGSVVGCNNTLTGEYKIAYGNSYIEAYSQNGESYNNNDSVYILIPSNNASDKKIILGKSTKVTNDDNITAVSAWQDNYNTIGRNVISDMESPVGLNSYLKNDNELIYSRENIVNADGKIIYDIKNNKVAIDEESFKTYAQHSDGIIVEASFQTRLPRQHQLSKTGEYGLIFSLVFNDRSNNGDSTKVKTLILDSSHMVGNPMRYSTLIDQNAIFDFDKDNFLYIDQIIAYSTGFVQKDNHEQELLWGDDIFISNLEIYNLQKISSISGDYILKVSTPDGAIFNSFDKKEILRIHAQTTYQGLDISDQPAYYYFIKDDRINSSSEDYRMVAGAGWKYLSNLGAKQECYINASNNRAKENEYLIVALYKQTVILKQNIIVYNTKADNNIKIISDLGTTFSFDRGTPKLTCLIGDKSENFDSNYHDDDFVFAWSIKDKLSQTTILNTSYNDLKSQYDNLISKNTGKYSELAAIRNQMSIMKDINLQQDGSYLPLDKNILIYPVNQISDSVTISCSVYIKSNDTSLYIGSATIVLTNENAANPNTYKVVIENGSQVFQYNESGVSPSSERYIDQLELLPLSAHFFDPAGLEIDKNTYSVKWLVPQSDTMIVSPKEGMITNPSTGISEWYNERIYPVQIAENYDYQALNNQVTCIIDYYGVQYQQDTDFLFTKIGDNGTNGTDIVTKISPVGNQSYIIKKFNGQVIAPKFKMQLYNRNTLLASSDAKWTIAGSAAKAHNLSIDDNGQTSWGDLKGKYYNQVIRGQIRDSGLDYYAFYPVSYIQYNKNVDYTVNINQTKLLKYVTYNHDGRNPLYNKNQGIQLEFSKDITRNVRWEVFGGLNNTNPILTLSSKKNEIAAVGENAADFVYIVPDDVYSGEYCNNVIHGTVTNNGVSEVEVWIPIHLSLNTYGLKSLNAWDGNHVEINEEDNYILAPQIGAGEKNDKNQFTGILMGGRKTYDNKDDNNEVGLFGYSKGQQSIFLNAEDGSATFGLVKDDTDANNYSEGIVKLVPGGTSRISRWNIGSRALYAIYGQKDENLDAMRPAYSDYVDSSKYNIKGAQFSIPAIGKGAILSGNPAFLSLKGKRLDNEDKDIDFTGSNTQVKVGDSLEAEIDPSKVSIFSIYRHTRYDDDGELLPNGKWRRYPLVGFNQNGEFFTNALKQGSTTMSIGKIGAFGQSAASAHYIGSHFQYKKDNIFKFFIDGNDNAGTGRLYLTGGTLINNEYQRPIGIYGKSVDLYASQGSKENTSEYALNIGADRAFFGYENHTFLSLYSKYDKNTKLQSSYGLTETINNGNLLLSVNDGYGYVENISGNKNETIQGNKIESIAGSKDEKVAGNLKVSSNALLSLLAKSNLDISSNNGTININAKNGGINQTSHLSPISLIAYNSARANVAHLTINNSGNFSLGSSNGTINTSNGTVNINNHIATNGQISAGGVIKSTGNVIQGNNLIFNNVVRIGPNPHGGAKIESNSLYEILRTLMGGIDNAHSTAQNGVNNAATAQSAANSIRNDLDRNLWGWQKKGNYQPAGNYQEKGVYVTAIQKISLFDSGKKVLLQFHTSDGVTHVISG